jgi:hypothetical protein
MSYKAYTVLVSKTAVPHPGALQQKAADLAKNAGVSASQQWFAWRGNDWVIGFANNYGPAFQFTLYCARNGIPFRAQWRAQPALMMIVWVV